MDTNGHNFPNLVRNGAGQLINDRRARPRRPPRHRMAEPGQAMLSTITLALLDEELLRAEAGRNPYDNGQGRDPANVWGKKRR